MGVAKALPRFFPGAADDLARALAMSAARQDLKYVFRLGLSEPAPFNAVREYRTAEAIAAGATRTNLGFNLAGAAAIVGAGTNLALQP
jgi:hypothetical protein